MGEHHCVHQPNAPRDHGRQRIREGAEHAGPEEEQAGGRERHIESFEQPHREQ
jgi:hypothetical protein